MQNALGARVMREIRTLRGNINSEFPEDNRPSSYERKGRLKSRFIRAQGEISDWS